MAKIRTVHGELDESLLEKRTGGKSSEKETSEWVEYWLNGELVHRSAHVVLKKPIAALGEIGKFG